MTSESISDKFSEVSDQKTFDEKHRQTINFNIGKYNAAVKGGMGQFENHELARAQAAYVKSQAINHLSTYLIEFENHFTARGGKVIWAKDTLEAQTEIINILKAKGARLVVKSKSMTTEEIHLNEFLDKNGVESFETDLGEYIVQLAGQKPYHIVTPAMHMSRKDIADLFERKLKTPADSDAETLVAVARALMREKYTSADVGISGGNFLIADIGGVAITENEGNARLSVTFPKVHIAIVGIEKVLPTLADLNLFWPMLAASGTGQQVTVYNSVVCGPRQPGEVDGPEEMIVILLDNGRTNLLADPEKRQALNCIRCGACLNACPVYKNIGGHTYDATYSGPIGSVITPHLAGMAEYKHLSYASSLCGACTSVCPVKIDIHNLLLLNRRQAVEQGLAPPAEKRAFQAFRFGMKHRWLLDIGHAKMKNWFFQQAFGKSWGKRRANLEMPKNTFHDLWKKRIENTSSKR